MTDEVREVVNALQSQLEKEGYTIYCKQTTNNTPIPVLVMYHTKEKKYLVTAFSPDSPGVYSQVPMWHKLAESKAEQFGDQEVSDYRVFKDVNGHWSTEEYSNARKH